jgi:glycosyltransferase involved in cell wall biosynthesis
MTMHSSASSRGGAVSDRVRVSIVTPFLNAERFIAESIESVLAQTYRDWELLLVDDGSTDGSGAIAARFAAAYPQKIRCFAHEGRQNKGASASRNLGIAHAHGEYMAFLDADDVYLPPKLTEQVPLLDAHPEVAMTYAGTEYWHSWTGRTEDAGADWTWRNYGVETNIPIAAPRMLTTFLRRGGTVPCMGSVLVRRSAIEHVGGWEDAFRCICTDQVFHAKICLSFPVLIVDACWDRYRQHEASSCQTVERAGEMNTAFLRYLNWLGAYLDARGVTDPNLRRALRCAFRRYRYPMLRRALRSAARCETYLRDAGGRVIRRAMPAPLRRRLRARWS